MGNFTTSKVDAGIADSIDFMVERVSQSKYPCWCLLIFLKSIVIQNAKYMFLLWLCFQLESLSQQDLASRLTMNCVNCYVEPHKMKDVPVTIIDVFDEYALSSPVREELYKCYPSARLAHLKSGGNFPYLSRSDQVNVYLQVCLLTAVQ